jgi:hypothetical protein
MALVISASLMALVSLRGSQDQAATQEDVVRRFIRAFFSEDEKTLLPLSTGRAASDLKSYFWIRRKILDESSVVTRKWDGKIEILGKDREKLLAADRTEMDGFADVFKVAVNGKLFRCGLDESNKVVLFNDPVK